MSTLIDSLGPFVQNMHFAYFGCALLVMTTLGCPWIWVRKRFVSCDTRRRWSSLIIALAFAPGIMVGHQGGITVPAVLILLSSFGGYRSTFAECMWHFGMIAFVWAMVIILRGLWSMSFGRCVDIRRRHDPMKEEKENGKEAAA